MLWAIGDRRRCSERTEIRAARVELDWYPHILNAQEHCSGWIDNLQLETGG